MIIKKKSCFKPKELKEKKKQCKGKRKSRTLVTERKQINYFLNNTENNKFQTKRGRDRRKENIMMISYINISKCLIF